MQTKRAVICILLAFASLALGSAAKDSPSVDPGPDSRCAVCGMFVIKYPNWIAQVEYPDGSVFFFDGPKDMFRFLLDVRKYRPQSNPVEPDGIFVTDYYRTKRIDGRTAFYVAGSDVNGPMGKELVPLDTEEAAAEFKSDHRAERILRFGEIDRDCLGQLR